MSIQSKLAQLDKDWEGVKDEFGDSTGGFPTVPSANYVVFKVKGKLDESGKGNLMVKRSAEIKEGDLEGETVYDNMNIETDRGPEFLLKWLNLMGLQVDSLKKDLPKSLEMISANEDATFQCSIKEKDGYNNMYFNKVLEEGNIGEGSDTTGGGDAGGDSDMPDLDDLSKRQLKKLIKENDLEVKPDDFDDDDELRDAIEEAWKEKPADEPAEKTTSRRASRKDSGKDDKKIVKALEDICDAFGIEFADDSSLADLKKTLDGYTFKKKNLEESEMKTLEDAGLGKTIK